MIDKKMEGFNVVNQTKAGFFSRMNVRLQLILKKYSFGRSLESVIFIYFCIQIQTWLPDRKVLMSPFFLYKSYFSIEYVRHVM